MSLLEVRDLTKRFAGVVATDGVSLSVPAGSIVGLIGPNGAGKTTLVNLVTGYLRPDAGTVRFRGEDVVGRRPHHLARAGIARTYQNLRLFDGASVLENVLVGRHLAFRQEGDGARRRPWGVVVAGRGGGRARRRAQADAARRLVARMGLDAVVDSDVDDLPYGLRRRVEIARALATEPKLVLLDEPTAGMTRAESDDVAAVIEEVNTAGVTVVLVEHNVRLVTAVCHRVAVLERGACIAEGPPAQVWADPRVRAAYLGESLVAGGGGDDGAARGA